MKNVFDVKKMPIGILGLGILGFALRAGLYVAAMDEKSLLLRFHPLEWALWLVAALTAGLVVWGVWGLCGSQKYEHNFGPSKAAAWGSGLFAGGIGVTVLLSGLPVARLDQACWLFGVLAAASLAAGAVCRARGQKPFFLLHCAVCVYLALYMVNHYQPWSSTPQLQHYVFQLLAVVSMTMFAYYQAAFALGLGRRRRYLALGLLGGFCCVTSLAHTQDFLLYLTGAVWCLTGLCNWEPVPAEPAKEAPKEDGV
ncbi:MAG: hypothetical protein IJ001_00290 [Oscillospiraceae bacterium]|nr:hypothetical protein [Oscillospiraceae bacterium]